MVQAVQQVGAQDIVKGPLALAQDSAVRVRMALGDAADLTTGHPFLAGWCAPIPISHAAEEVMAAAATPRRQCTVGLVVIRPRITVGLGRQVAAGLMDDTC